MVHYAVHGDQNSEGIGVKLMEYYLYEDAERYDTSGRCTRKGVRLLTIASGIPFGQARVGTTTETMR